MLGHLYRGIGADSAVVDQDDVTTAEEIRGTTTPNESPLYECLPFSKIRVNCYSTFGITWRNVHDKHTTRTSPSFSHSARKHRQSASPQLARIMALSLALNFLSTHTHNHPLLPHPWPDNPLTDGDD